MGRGEAHARRLQSNLVQRGGERVDIPGFNQRCTAGTRLGKSTDGKGYNLAPE